MSYHAECQARYDATKKGRERKRKWAAKRRLQMKLMQQKQSANSN